MIHQLAVYQTKGRQFDSMEKAIEHRENLVEAWMRKLPGFADIPPQDRIKFMELLLAKRKELIDLLSYEDQPEVD